MNYIFLDIDGVLNNIYQDSVLIPDKVEMLNKLIEDLDAKVVITSDWRYDKDAYHSIFWTVRNVVGCTKLDSHVYPIQKYEEIRVDEIQEYIEQNDVEKYAVLDDMDLKIKNMFKTDMSEGLTQAICDNILYHFSQYSRK